MPHKQMLAEVFASNLELVRMALGDFSDEDMLRRPVPGANHAMWQVGHLVNSETGLLNTASPGAAPALPAGFERMYGHETTSCDDAEKFLRKDEVLDLLGKVRQATIEWVKMSKLPELDKPSPEKLQRLCPTIGHIPMLILGHTAMHVGQIQVIRRALGKPVLF